ncbi:MAG: DUF2721 domain-containing protein [Planctomycetota bacterium]
MSTVPGVIQELVAPAVMIPASALLLLSSTARMNVVLARIRTFHREQLDVWCQDPAAGSKQEAVRETRLEGLEHQVHRLLIRARLLRATMLILFTAITCFLIAMLLLGAQHLVEEPAPLYRGSVYMLSAGVVLMLTAMVTSIAEVGAILHTLRYEHRRVEYLLGHDPESMIVPPRTSDAGEGVGL